MQKIDRYPLGWAIAASLLYVFAAKVGMNLSALQPSNITLLWLPSGIALVIYLQWGYRAFPLVCLASFAANFSGMAADSGAQPLLHTLIAALTDGFAGLLAALLFQRFLPDGLRGPKDLLPFGFWVCLLPNAVSGSVLAVNLFFGGYIAWDELGKFVHMLILADSLGMLLVYPVYQGWRHERRLSVAERYWLLALASMMTIVLFFSFSSMPGALYFSLPWMTLLAFYVGLSGVASLVLLSAVVIIAATARGLGPFVGHDTASTHFELMAFVYSYTLAILGTALLSRDIENRKVTEAALLSSQTKFKTLFESSSEAVMLLNEKGFFDCNDAALRMFGCRNRADFCSRHPADLSPPLQPDGQTSQAVAGLRIQSALQAGSQFFEYQHRRADDQRDFPAEVLLSAMVLDGQPALLATVRDITERQKAAQELIQHRDNLQHLVVERTVDLQHAKELAERANQAKSEFLTNMSHELRTPLHATLAFARMGLDKSGDASREKLAQYFKRIHESAERLTRLVDDLLDLSKLDTGNMAFRPGRQDLGQLLALALGNLAGFAGQKNLRIKLQKAIATAPIHGDERLINQVLVNVLDNAIKFSAPGSEVAIHLDSVDQGFRLRVIDQGPGIPPDEVNQVFERFTQSSKTRTGAGGTGLGLSIAREIMRLHQGSIMASNNDDQGACLTLIFPADGARSD